MLILGIIVFLVLSAFFSASEIAFVSANKLGIEVLKNKGSRRGNTLASFYDNAQSFISTMLVGNNIALVIFTYLMTQFLSGLFFGDPKEDSILSLFVNTLLITVIVLIFGEFLPKTLSRIYANKFLFSMTYPLKIFQWILAIPTWFMTGLSYGVLRVFLRTKVENVELNLTRVDLEHFIDEELSETDEDIDKEILVNALNLNQLKVRDCMIPRTEIIHVDKSASVEELTSVFQESNLSRVVVIGGDIENVIGYIHHQALLDNPKSIDKIRLDLEFVPEAMNARDLLYHFIKTSTGIACVVDEFGGTAGLITIEDILEEIFGEIEDEHDSSEEIEEQISETEFIFSGRLETDYLNEKYDQINIPDGEYNTLSGYIVMTSGTIPSSGEEITLDNYQFVLIEVSETKIETIKMIILPVAQEE